MSKQGIKDMKTRDRNKRKKKRISDKKEKKGK